MAGARNFGALGKTPPPPNREWVEMNTGRGTIHPDRITLKGGLMTGVMNNPWEWGHTSNYSSTWGDRRLIQHRYQPVVWHQGRDPDGVPLPRSDQKQEVPNWWYNALCITWWLTYDVNKGGVMWLFVINSLVKMFLRDLLQWLLWGSSVWTISTAPGECKAQLLFEWWFRDWAASSRARCQDGSCEVHLIQFDPSDQLLHPLIVIMQGGVFMRVWKCFD